LVWFERKVNFLLWIRIGFDAGTDPACKVIAALDPHLDPVPDQDQRFDEKSCEIIQLAKNYFFLNHKLQYIYPLASMKGYPSYRKSI
jgi:hypothetical protein